MKMKRYYMPTLREDPQEAEIISHKLLLRAGMIRKSAAGIYSYLPLGYRTIRKVENIVREEMDRMGGYEILMSALQPKEIWEESGRWQTFGPEMFKVKDRNEREFCLGPTAEEYFTTLISGEIKSYKQLLTSVIIVTTLLLGVVSILLASFSTMNILVIIGSVVIAIIISKIFIGKVK